MTEVSRITGLLEQTFEGKPYYGPSVLGALASVTADLAVRKPHPHVHSIWELVVHLVEELNYARAVIEGSAGPWIEGETTWPVLTDTSEAAWQFTLRGLAEANTCLVGVVKLLDEGALDATVSRVQVPLYVMLHGTIQHSVYHAGQISLLARP
jgi:hypothetical protein